MESRTNEVSFLIARDNLLGNVSLHTLNDNVDVLTHDPSGGRYSPGSSAAPFLPGCLQLLPF
jgi:hypothetical protein